MNRVKKILEIIDASTQEVLRPKCCGIEKELRFDIIDEALVRNHY